MKEDTLKIGKQTVVPDAIVEGEWVKPKHRDYRLGCCDCGSIHRMNFRVRGGMVEYQVFRDDVNTRRARRMCNFICKKARKRG